VLWFWINAPRLRASPCGAVATGEDGIVIGSAPYFGAHWRGQHLNTCIRSSGASWKRLEPVPGIVVVVTGGRNYSDRAFVWTTLDDLHASRPLSLLVEGGASGLDTLARDWAHKNGIPARREDADWTDLSHPDAVVRTRRDRSRYDAKAGHRRNQLMLDKYDPDVMCVFPGGMGTADCCFRGRASEAERGRPFVWDLR
jgi:hypothetical protein